MVDTVKSWPVYHDLLKQLYHELLKIVQEKVVDVDRIFELFMELYGLLLPKTIVDTVESWPVYHELLKPLYYELLKIVREKIVDVDRIFELFRELYTRGNVFNDLKCNRISLCYVLTYMKFHDTE